MKIFIGISLSIICIVLTIRLITYLWYYNTLINEPNNYIFDVYRSMANKNIISSGKKCFYMTSDELINNIKNMKLLNHRTSYINILNGYMISLNNIWINNKVWIPYTKEDLCRVYNFIAYELPDSCNIIKIKNLININEYIVFTDIIKHLCGKYNNSNTYYSTVIKDIGQNEEVCTVIDRKMKTITYNVHDIKDCPSAVKMLACYKLSQIEMVNYLCDINDDCIDIIKKFILEEFTNIDNDSERKINSLIVLEPLDTTVNKDLFKDVKII